MGLLVASSLLGQKRKDHATHDVYESGVFGTGSAQFKINVPFYRTAILFIIFDLEAAILFAWAISVRESGWMGYIEVSIFIGILLAGLLYLWRSGALEWRTSKQQNDRAELKGEGGVVNTGPNKVKLDKEAARHAVHHGHEDHDADHDAGHHDAGHTGATH